MNNIGALLTHPDIFQSAFTSPAEFPLSPQVRRACEMNLCGRYGRSWTCPPAVGSEQESAEKLAAFDNAFVFTFVGHLEDSFDIEGMDAARCKAAQIRGELTERLGENGIKYLPLGCGSCDICECCTYPDSPCRFPEKAVVSVEAYGTDVVALAAKLGINYHNGANTVTYFNAILY
ncbi:MAG: DUF2284 domain-containing protein [Clostridiales bacterium]|nr:DUF2284 domain-containing protein [Clostridiales bacterium]